MDMRHKQRNSPGVRVALTGNGCAEKVHGRNLRGLPCCLSTIALLVVATVLALVAYSAVISIAQPTRAQTVETTGVCPLRGYATISRGVDWGASRSISGWHAGHDIFVPELTAVVAVENGIVQYRYGDVGGYNILLYADNGNVYYYAHLFQHDAVNLINPEEPMKLPDRLKNERWVSRWTAVGTRIGGVSDTGNAVGTGHHLHYGVRLGSLRNHVDPKPYIDRDCPNV